VPVDDTDMVLKSVCVDGLTHSPRITVPPGETILWTTEITTFGHGAFEIAVIIQELSRRKAADCRRWVGGPCRISCHKDPNL